jgi:SAM-dependent methyltransferase
VPHLPNRNLDILYAASASGIVGETLLSHLNGASLTLVDISKKHLDQNINPDTTKICADLLSLDLGLKFDLILMRSSLDYFPSKELQIRVLKILKQHLKHGGLFINQPAYIEDLDERNLVSEIYQKTPSIGGRLFQSNDIGELYKEAGLGPPEHIGDGKKLILTEKDHAERYGLEEEDVNNIQKAIKRTGRKDMATNLGYKLEFEFPIFIAKQ